MGVLFYLAAREHPDYVRAAKGLPAARAEAEEAFGALTWEEYRIENGYSGDADLSQWKTVADSVPNMVKAQYSSPTIPHSSQEVFLAEREWFATIGSKVEDLRGRHIAWDDDSDWKIGYVSESKAIVKALRVGIIGAADEGDAEAVLSLGRVTNRLIEEILVEPSLLPAFVAIANRAILNHALMRAAVRNRTNKEVVQSVQTVFDESPRLRTYREISSADVRSMDIYLEQLRNISPAKLDVWLDDFGDQAFLDQIMASSQSTVFDWFESVTGNRPGYKRNIKDRAAAGLEARYWEVQLKQFRIGKDLLANKPGARNELDKLENAILLSGDRSYEFAHSFFISGFAEIHLKKMFDHQVASVGVELAFRFPEYDDLPAKLPADLVFADPYGGKPILYRKTPTGFLIYSRMSNEIDDGFPVIDLNMLRREANTTRADDMLDWGLVISYDPLDPIP